MFLCEAIQILDPDNLTIMANYLSIVTPKHLVDFAIDDPQFSRWDPFFKGRESQVEATFGITKFPKFHIIAGNISEFYLP